MNGRMVLMQRLWGLRMLEGDDMAQHLNHFREIANQLQSLSEDGKGMEDSELVTILTVSLPQSYKLLVMALQSRSDTITFDLMAGRLLQESGRRQISQGTNPTQGGTSTSSTAFTAHRPVTGTQLFRGQGGNYGNGRGRGGYPGRFHNQAFGATQNNLRRNTG